MAKASVCAAAFPNQKGTVEPLPQCLKGAKGVSAASSTDFAIVASVTAMFMSLFAIGAAAVLV